jgi:hypothetical protein
MSPGGRRRPTNVPQGCPDLAVVDALARLQLVARRLGCSICLANPSPELIDLVELAGLSDVLQVVREAEHGEQLRIDEVVMPNDPIA